MTRGRGAVVATALLVAAAVGGCGGSGREDAESSGAPERLAVGTRVETLVDTTRPTEARGDVAGKPSRTLETFVYYPASGPAGKEPVAGAPAATAGSPFPLVVFSHGSGVDTPLRYDLLFRSWAAAGYVVAAPRYPLSSTALPGSGSDVVNQPADVSFLIGELLRRSDDAAGPYRGLLDPARIAVAGHSLGGVTTLAVGFNSCCVDRRIRAGVVLAGAADGFPAEGWFAGIRTPILVVHGDEDRIVRLAEGQKVFAGASPPKVMLTVIGGDHNRPYGGSLATTENPERLGATVNGPTTIVNTAVVAFLDRYLKDRHDALVRARNALADEVTVKLEIVDA